MVHGLLVGSLFLPFVFCGGPVFPCVSVSWSFGGLGFCVVFVLLVLLRDDLGLAFGGPRGLMISVVVAAQVLGSHVQAVRGGRFASVSPFGGYGSHRVCPSSHLGSPMVWRRRWHGGARRAEGVVVVGWSSCVVGWTYSFAKYVCARFG